jgi:isoleucyl-tRNA synthetase
VRSVVNLGHGLRKRHQLKVRQPLSRLTVVTRHPEVATAVESHRDLIGEELNVREVTVERHESHLVHLSAKANFKVLGPRLGAGMSAVAAAIERLGHDDVEALLEGETVQVDGHPVTIDHVVVHRDPRDGVVVAAEATMSVALDTEVTDEMRREGTAREVISRIQALRRDADLAVTDRVTVLWHTADPHTAQAIADHADLIAGEVLATSLEAADSPRGTEVEVEGNSVWLEVAAAT